MRRSLRMKTLAAVAGAALTVILSAGPGHAQESTAPPAGRGGGQFAGMQRVAGEITAISGVTMALRSEDGSTVSIVTTENTRVMKGRGLTVKVADLKPGDGVMAVGNLDAPNKTLHAAMLFATDAAQLKALRENLGKTYIAGRVTAVDLDNARMTVERTDHVKQTIGFDETTSFRRGRGRGPGGGMGMGGGMAMGGSPEGRASETRSSEARSAEARSSEAGPGQPPAGESITLADVKAGDTVAGQGALKGGVFVPTQLLVSTPGMGRGPREGRPAGAGAAPTAPASTPAPPVD